MTEGRSLAPVFHLPTELHYYPISNEKLELLKKCSDNNSKDYFLVCASISISTLISAFYKWSNSSWVQFQSLYMFVGLLTLVLAITYYNQWQNNQLSWDDHIKEITSRPIATTTENDSFSEVTVSEIQLTQEND